MRYSFNNEAIALINRVEAAAFQRTLQEYGRSNIRLLAALWLEVDLGSDWGGEDDHVHAEYPALNEAWEARRESNFENHEENSRYDNAMHVAFEFENRLLIAICVVNALEALQNGAGNIWAQDKLLQRVNEEFEQERENVTKSIHKALAGD